MTTKLGPVARELRDRGCSKNEDWIGLSPDAVYTVYAAAGANGLEMYDMDASADVLSYAIEAAEALGL